MEFSNSVFQFYIVFPLIKKTYITEKKEKHLFSYEIRSFLILCMKSWIECSLGVDSLCFPTWKFKSSWLFFKKTIIIRHLQVICLHLCMENYFTFSFLIFLRKKRTSINSSFSFPNHQKKNINGKHFHLHFSTSESLKY